MCANEIYEAMNDNVAFSVICDSHGHLEFGHDVDSERLERDFMGLVPEVALVGHMNDFMDLVPCSIQASRIYHLDIWSIIKARLWITMPSVEQPGTHFPIDIRFELPQPEPTPDQSLAMLLSAAQASWDGVRTKRETKQRESREAVLQAQIDHLRQSCMDYFTDEHFEALQQYIGVFEDEAKLSFILGEFVVEIIEHDGNFEALVIGYSQVRKIDVLCTLDCSIELLGRISLAMAELATSTAAEDDWI